MSCYWLISSCSFFFCFRRSPRFAFNLSLSLLYLSLCVCLIASLFPSSIPLILRIFFVSIFLVFLLACIQFFSHHVVWFSLYFSIFSIWILFLLFEVMLSCGIAKLFLDPPTIHLLRQFLSFSIYSPSFFSGCFLFWHGCSSIRFFF